MNKVEALLGLLLQLLPDTLDVLCIRDYLMTNERIDYYTTWYVYGVSMNNMNMDGVTGQ